MSTKRNTDASAADKIICEVVAFRYADEDSWMLVGEAEITLWVMADADAGALVFADLLAARIDLLTVFDTSGADVYAKVMALPKLKTALETAALAHYLHPPQIPIGLPQHRPEW